VARIDVGIFARRYILVYPNGCDVSNHLSLFLCVADYDKLLPGACGIFVVVYASSTSLKA